MARLLVATDLSSMGQRGLAERLAQQATRDGHEAAVVTDAPLAACRDADAAVCLIDGSAPGAMPIAVAATAHALGLPTLALHTHSLPDALASLFTQAVAVSREEDLAAALPAFYAQVRPFAGKLVRDQVPRLVREAGHDVHFRVAEAGERPLYLKRKVADEAQELLHADPGQEREEVADLLEALEALLRVRGFDRDDLKLVKEAKRKRRGGFERFLVVESATGPSTTALPPQDAWPAEEPRLVRRSAPEPAPAYEPPRPAPAPVREPDPEPLFTMPPAFAEPTPQASTVHEPEPDVAMPNWLADEAPAAAAGSDGGMVLEPVTLPDVPQVTYEAPPTPFTPPAIPSFRQAAAPPAATAPTSRRSTLWNLGKAGDREEIPESVEDPDRVEPSVRDV